MGATTPSILLRAVHPGTMMWLKDRTWDCDVHLISYISAPSAHTQSQGVLFFFGLEADVQSGQSNSKKDIFHP